MELCRNLAHSLCDYERKNQRRPFKTTSDHHAANKVLLFKVLVKNSYGKLFNKNDPIKVRFVRTIDKALINKKQIQIKEDSTFTRSTYTINSYAY